MTENVVEVVPFSEALAPYFAVLNREWIERYFAIEEPDRVIFADPYSAIVKAGGQIFFVLVGGEVVGTCAVVRYTAETYELAKMAVTPKAQGHGYGSILLEAAIKFARAAGGKKIFLLTNSILGPALRLYEKHGFRQVPPSFSNDYARADVQMELSLEVP